MKKSHLSNGRFNCLVLERLLDGVNVVIVVIASFLPTVIALHMKEIFSVHYSVEYFAVDPLPRGGLRQVYCVEAITAYDTVSLFENRS